MNAHIVLDRRQKKFHLQDSEKLEDNTKMNHK
jgi:hypothetical protein